MTRELQVTQSPFEGKVFISISSGDFVQASVILEKLRDRWKRIAYDFKFTSTLNLGKG